MLLVNIKRTHPLAQIPTYGTDGAACFDLHAVMEPAETSSTHVHPGTPATFSTGLQFEIPKDYVMLVFSRSGHGFKNDVRLANCTGVIDSDYRGEVMVKLTSDNGDKNSMIVRHGDRIAQAMIVPVEKVAFFETDELSNTDRGTGGFGSTGA